MNRICNTKTDKSRWLLLHLICLGSIRQLLLKLLLWLLLLNNLISVTICILGILTLYLLHLLVLLVIFRRIIIVNTKFDFDYTESHQLSGLCTVDIQYLL